MATHQIIAVSIHPLRSRRHETVTAVVTRQGSADIDTHWSLSAVLRAMNGAHQFVTRAANGGQARVQRYTCGGCRAEHIRTHIGDGAIAGALLRDMPRIVNPPDPDRSRDGSGESPDLPADGGPSHPQISRTVPQKTTLGKFAEVVA
jgi:hypothetical protein